MPLNKETNMENEKFIWYIDTVDIEFCLETLTF